MNDKPIKIKLSCFYGAMGQHRSSIEVKAIDGYLVYSIDGLPIYKNKVDLQTLSVQLEEHDLTTNLVRVDSIYPKN